MRLRRFLTGFAALLLLAAMFVAVHRGARGRMLAERIGELEGRQAAAEVQRAELLREIEVLQGRARIVRVASQQGLHLPSEDELVILEVSGPDDGSGP